MTSAPTGMKKAGRENPPGLCVLRKAFALFPGFDFGCPGQADIRR
jgi:hypothetical protein